MEDGGGGGGEKIKLGSLWRREDSHGTPYWTGSLGEARLLVFTRVKKGDRDEPDLDIYIVRNNNPPRQR